MTWSNRTLCASRHLTVFRSRRSFTNHTRRRRRHKVPALVWVHGGPGGQTRKGYSALIQYLVNHGYAVLGHQQPRQLRLRPDVLHRRRPQAWPRASARLRRGQSVPGRNARYRSRQDRHHRRQLRRLHGPGGPGLRARFVRRGRRHLRRIKLAPHAGEHSSLLGSRAPGALSRDRRSREGPRDAQSDLPGLPRAKRFAAP